MRKLCILIILFFLDITAYAGIITGIEFEKEVIFPETTKQYLLVRSTDSAPKMDGELNDICWKKASKIEFADTSCYLTYDEKFLYLAFSCFQSKPLIIKNKAHDSRIWEDDCVEIFIDTNNDHKTYYQFLTNPLGARYDGFIMDKSWNSNWQAVALVKGNIWQAEVAIPFSDIGIKKIIPGMVWGFNLNVNHGTESSFSWSYLLSPTNHAPAQFNHLILGDSPIILKDILLGDASIGKNILFLKLENKKKRLQIIKAKIDVENSSFHKEINLFPGENYVELGYQIKKKGETNLNLSGFDKKKRLFAYQYTLIPSPVAIISCSLPTSIYYLSDRKINPEIKINNILSEELAGMRLRVEMKKDKEVISSEEIKKISSRKVQLSLDISVLKSGSYSLNLSLIDKDDKILGETEQNFSINKGPFD